MAEVRSICAKVLRGNYASFPVFYPNTACFKLISNLNLVHCVRVERSLATVDNVIFGCESSSSIVRHTSTAQLCLSSAIQRQQQEA